MKFKRYVDALRRLQGAFRKYGVLWTMEKSIALLRVKLAHRSAKNSLDEAFQAVISPAPKYLSTPILVDEIGVVPSVRPTNVADKAFGVPFRRKIDHAVDRVAVIAHIFYVEYGTEIRSYIENIPIGVDVFVSTDTTEKRDRLTKIFGDFKLGEVEIRVMPNKGRDIAPKLVGFSDVYSSYEYVLHIHSKRSPHGGDGLKDWRKYLYEHLLGSPEIVDSNLTLLSHPSVGMVFPQHYFGLRGVLNWGYDFNFAKALLLRVGISLRKDNLLEFPSGSMFWARSAALKRLVNIGLDFDDFEEEAGKIDGTLAHAIERSYLFFVEAAGFQWAKVCIPEAYPLKKAVISIESMGDISLGLQQVYRSVLSRPITFLSPMERTVPTCRRLVASPSNVARPRLNLLIPTVNPDQIFGGVSTALTVFEALSQSLGSGFDRRIVVTDAKVLNAALPSLQGYRFSPDSQSCDDNPSAVFDMTSRDSPLSLRRGDFFMASAWWNAAQGYQLKERQQEYFSAQMPFVYLIQDFEPNFSAWSSQWVAAEETYRKASESIAIINSNELYAYMTQRYGFKKSFLLPYTPNRTITGALQSIERKKQILIYGRPSVMRNCFELLLDGLLAWQQNCPIEAAEWSIVSVGENYPDECFSPVQNVSVRGKVDLTEYGRLLSESSIGISLMASPHPSYPPLEMAQAGVLTITNTFECKDLSSYSDLMMNIERFDADALADAIDLAVKRVGRGSVPKVGELTPLKVPAPNGPIVDYEVIASQLNDAFSWSETTESPLIS